MGTQPSFTANSEYMLVLQWNMFFMGYYFFRDDLTGFMTGISVMPNAE